MPANETAVSIRRQSVTEVSEVCIYDMAQLWAAAMDVEDASWEEGDEMMGGHYRVPFEEAICVEITKMFPQFLSDEISEVSALIYHLGNMLERYVES